jgi:hypothetical protein
MPLVATPANSSIDFVATTITAPLTAATTQITVTGGSGTGAVTYAVASASASVCTVSSTGLVTNRTAGSCVINVTKAADANYLIQNTSTTITFNKLNQAELVAVPADESEPFVFSPRATNQITTTGGTGTGLVVDVTLDQYDFVNGVVVRTPGSGYTVGDTITISGAGVSEKPSNRLSD